MYSDSGYIPTLYNQYDAQAVPGQMFREGKIMEQRQ